ncbi:hypothetical protein ACWQFH_11580, partial [Acinetobacter baumannii]
MKRTLLCCLTLLSCPFLYADEDTQLRLNQSLDQTLLQEQRQFHEQGTIRSTEQLPKLQINGQEYSVEQNPNDLAKALYLAVMQKQWLKATVYLEHSLYTTNFTEPLSYQDSAFLKLPKFP